MASPTRSRRTPTPTHPFLTSRPTHARTHPILIVYKSSKAHYEGPNNKYHRAQVAIAQVAPYRYILQVFVGPLVSDSEAYRHIVYDEDFRTDWKLNIEEAMKPKSFHQVKWGSPGTLHSLRFNNTDEVWDFATGFDYAASAVQEIQKALVKAMDIVHTSLFSSRFRELNHPMSELDIRQFQEESAEYIARDEVKTVASACIDESDRIPYSVFDAPSVDKIPPLVVGTEGFDDRNARSLFPVVIHTQVTSEAIDDD
ncbi:hypothetical protein BC629DRAFT_1443741 [Irpex lacteus]|nr:hypothetical protein BC629DRAFT_1443741 [Irpex lacteus]